MDIHEGDSQFHNGIVYACVKIKNKLKGHSWVTRTELDQILEDLKNE
jgi:hypothetical protein